MKEDDKQRWVVKVGSALMTNDGRGLDRARIADWVNQLVTLRGLGIEPVLVSSGAIAEGMSRLAMRKRPEAIHELQALAAVGQMGLVQVYESCFQDHDVHTAQVLLTHEDVANRRRYLNARITLRTLLRYGVVPVVNENDTVATREIRFGDNDTLAGLVANLTEADLMVLLTDQAGLYTDDPRNTADAKMVSHAAVGDPALDAMAGGPGGELARGGMRTKVVAARLAARSGTSTRIVHGHEPQVLMRLAKQEALGTFLEAQDAPITARKQWLAGQVRLSGRLQLDAGAANVLRARGTSLLAVGIADVSGEFERGAIVSCSDPAGTEVARGITNYSAAEISAITGHPSDRIGELLGYVREPEVIHRDNLVLMTHPSADARAS